MNRPWAAFYTPRFHEIGGNIISLAKINDYFDVIMRQFDGVAAFFGFPGFRGAEIFADDFDDLFQGGFEIELPVGYAKIDEVAAFASAVVVPDVEGIIDGEGWFGVRIPQHAEVEQLTAGFAQGFVAHPAWTIM